MVNRTAKTEAVHIYCLLYIGWGEEALYYFWPSWTEEVDKQYADLASGQEERSILTFTWPAGAGNSSIPVGFYCGLLSPNDIDIYALAEISFTYSEYYTPTPSPTDTLTPTCTLTPTLTPTPDTAEFQFIVNTPISAYCSDPTRPENCDYCFSIQHGNTRVREEIGTLELLVDYPVDIQIQVDGEAFEAPSVQANPVRLTPGNPRATVILQFFTEDPVYEWKTGTVAFVSTLTREGYSLCGYFSWF